MSKQCKPRRLWRPAVATHPRTICRLSMSCVVPGTKLHITVPRSGTLYHETHCKLQRSAAVGTCDTSTPYSSPKGD